jgi:hypothetical protein
MTPKGNYLSKYERDAIRKGHFRLVRVFPNCGIVCQDYRELNE